MIYTTTMAFVFFTYFEIIQMYVKITINAVLCLFSIISIGAKISLWVFKICGFEGGVGVLKQGGPFNSTGVGFLNHQTSKISIISIWAKISSWVFKICGFKGGIGVLKLRGPFNSTDPGFHDRFPFLCFRRYGIEGWK